MEKIAENIQRAQQVILHQADALEQNNAFAIQEISDYVTELRDIATKLGEIDIVECPIVNCPMKTELQK